MAAAHTCRLVCVGAQLVWWSRLIKEENRFREQAGKAGRTEKDLKWETLTERFPGSLLPLRKKKSGEFAIEPTVTALSLIYLYGKRSVTILFGVVGPNTLGT